MNFKEQLTPYPVLEKVVSAAKELGVEAYIIGGFVRDLILKRNSKDIDIVSIGSGIELAEMVAGRLGPDVHVSVFKNFVTAQIIQGDL